MTDERMKNRKRKKRNGTERQNTPLAHSKTRLFVFLLLSFLCVFLSAFNPKTFPSPTLFPFSPRETYTHTHTYQPLLCDMEKSKKTAAVRVLLVKFYRGSFCPKSPRHIRICTHMKRRRGEERRGGGCVYI
jgi:hypothetical protein